MKTFLYEEFWWAMHNLVAHPFMQIMWWLSLCNTFPRINNIGERFHEWVCPEIEENYLKIYDYEDVEYEDD